MPQGPVIRGFVVSVASCSHICSHNLFIREQYVAHHPLLFQRIGIGFSGFALRGDEVQLTVGKIGHSAAASRFRFLE